MGILEINNLYKRFGSHEVLKGLDMDVPKGSIFGFAGQNGAGKTTTMKIILGLLKPDSGTVTVCGKKVRYGETRTNRHIGFLPDVPEFYGFMTPMEYLAMCGEIAGLTKSETRKRSEELLELVGLKNIKRKTGGFSRGMKQRLGIAQALLNQPEILICDEPTSALDPVGRKEILDILLHARSKTTILFSTHILADVERICDRIAVLHDGKLALCGTLSEIKQRYRHNGFVIEFENEETASLFVNAEELKVPVIDLSREGNLVTVQIKEQMYEGRFLLGLLVRLQLVPRKFEVLEPTLESLFLEAVR